MRTKKIKAWQEVCQAVVQYYDDNMPDNEKKLWVSKLKSMIKTYSSPVPDRSIVVVTDYSERNGKSFEYYYRLVR